MFLFHKKKSFNRFGTIAFLLQIEKYIQNEKGV